MKVLVLLSFLMIGSALAHYAPLDGSVIVPISELPGFWEGREFPKAFYTQTERTRRVVGGQEVNPNAHNYKVALHLTRSIGLEALCGGTILSARAVLTAGHCVGGSSSVLIIAGAHNRNIVEATQQRQTVGQGNFRVHPNFNPSNFNNDLAIILTTTNFMFNVNVGPVRLPTAFANELFANELATSVGWGRISNTGETSPVLRSAANMVLTNAQCAAIYGASIVVNGTLCVQTGTIAGAQGACHGDDGGPLLIPRQGDTRAIQVGITSFFAYQGCVTGYPIGFTRVTNYLTWIQANM